MMTKILTVGVFDYFHYGHLLLFKRAKSLKDDAFLVVAVQEDAHIKKYKPEASLLYPASVRTDIISALKCVDEVIPYADVAALVRDADFDVFAVGEDQIHSGFQDAIAWCEANGKEVIRMARTPNISSSNIKEELK